MPKKKQSAQPWEKAMPEAQFKRLQDILHAPSPIGLEAAMTLGVLKPMFESFMKPGWALHTFKGNAGIVLDTHPGDDKRTSVMIVGHADKIRLQVRSIGDDGKIWVNSDSFLPTTLIGHDVRLFTENPQKPGTYRVIDGGTIEAVGAIHFAKPALRSGETGIKKEMLYLELQVYGKEPKKQIEKLGIRPGDSILLNRPIRRGFSPDTFYGAYLDNGLGCFVAEECARLMARRSDGLKNLRILYAAAGYEEIGRFGSRVLAGELKPDVLISVDVNFDLSTAPGVGDQRFPPLAMGEGYTVSAGAITSEFLNSQIETASRAAGIPFQRDLCGGDTGTDAMAGVLASIDTAAASLGFPIRNMHTISEIGHTSDVLACIHGIDAVLKRLDRMNEGSGVTRDDFRTGHPRLDQVKPLKHPGLRR